VNWSEDMHFTPRTPAPHLGVSDRQPHPRSIGSLASERALTVMVRRLRRGHSPWIPGISGT
jgi:hypothetical protein